MVTVGTIVGGGFRLIRERIASIAIWALLYLAMNVAVQFAIRPFMQSMMAMQAATAAGARPDPTAMLSGMGTLFGVYILLLLGLLILYTAALRAAVHPAQSAFAYLRLGMDELRMLAVAAVLGVGFFIVYFLLVLVAALVGGVMGFVAHDAIIPVVILLMLAVLAVLIFLQVRFSLAFALTMRSRKIMIGQSWRLTHGRFWTLFGAYLVIGLIVIASAMAIAAFTIGPYLAEIGRSGFDPQAVQAAQRQQLAQHFGAIGVMTVIGWVLGAVLGALWIALAAGVASAAATGLLDDGFDDIAAIYE